MQIDTCCLLRLINRGVKMEITDLSPEQQKAFNALKRDYKKCEKAGILFVNQYGAIAAYDSRLIRLFTDETTVIHVGIPDEDVVELLDAPAADYIMSVDSWGDDQIEHRLILTEKGKKLLQSNAGD